VVALWTSSLATVYVVMAAVIVALGVVNTILSSACARLASKEEIGGLFGVMEAVESLAGIVGPTVGGLLYRQHRQAPLAILVGVYAVVFVLVALLYRRHVVEHQPPASAAEQREVASVADDKLDKRD
jgi:MFS family permease